MIQNTPKIWSGFGATLNSAKIRWPQNNHDFALICIYSWHEMMKIPGFGGFILVGRFGSDFHDEILYQLWCLPAFRFASPGQAKIGDENVIQITGMQEGKCSKFFQAFLVSFTPERRLDATPFSALTFSTHLRLKFGRDLYFYLNTYCTHAHAWLLWVIQSDHQSTMRKAWLDYRHVKFEVLKILTKKA